jgi:hypothetical protein
VLEAQGFLVLQAIKYLTAKNLLVYDFATGKIIALNVY